MKARQDSHGTVSGAASSGPSARPITFPPAMPNQMRPFILEPGAGISVRNPVGGQLVFKLRGDQSNGAMTVFETVVAPNEGPPLHFHLLHDEWLYVLEGEMRFRLMDDVVPAPAASFVFIPRGVAHAWQNVGREPAVLLAMMAPSGLEQFFERYAKLTEQAGNLDTFRALAPDAGMTVIGPPLAQSHPTHGQPVPDAGWRPPRPDCNPAEIGWARPAGPRNGRRT